MWICNTVSGTCLIFDELCTINSVVYRTYHEATLELGLFSNNNEGFFALKAIMSYQTPGQLRFLFACIISVAAAKKTAFLGN
jgi:hypothetical protein